jgi:DNA-binding response OmpR family regulator
MKQHALVIDDDATIRLATCNYFNKRGYEVIEAENGARGIAELIENKQSIDIVILDLIMPEVDGFSFLASVDALKKAGTFTKMPRIIVLTVITNFAELKRLTNFECLHAVLKKPFNPSELDCHLPMLSTETRSDFIGSKKISSSTLRSPEG